MKIKDLLIELVQIGKLKGTEGDYGSVFGALKRDSSRFMRIGPGEYALLEPVGSGSTS